MFLLIPSRGKSLDKTDTNYRFVMYCGNGVIISHYKYDTKKLIFDVNMNGVKTDWWCIMENEKDTIFFELFLEKK